MSNEERVANWQRPVPNIGDATSAAERAAAPDGWKFSAEKIAALQEIMNARRDIRRYRPDAIPAELVHEILAAGHAGPSVGHSQPWRFLVIDDADIRAQAAVMADKERLRQAELLTPERRAKLLDLQLEGIREAPMAIVVACDRRTPASGVLGRNTFTDADMWSCACAIENMWLTARARGLGMGWVTLFQPAELAELLGLPNGVETLGWMCLGWPDERPPSPGLERRAWSHKLPLDELIFQNRWPDAAPPSPVSGLADLHKATQAPDQQNVVGARDEADRLLTPPGSLGVLDNALDKVVAAGGGYIDQATVVLVGADHPATKFGISAFEPTVTKEVMEAAVAGESLGVVTAKQLRFSPTIIVDAGVTDDPVAGAKQIRCNDARGDLGVDELGKLSPAMSEADMRGLVAYGRELVREIPGKQLVCLGEIGVGNTTIAAALGAGLINANAKDMVGIGAGSDSAMVERKIKLVEQALDAVHKELGENPDPFALLARLGGPEFAVLTGVVQGAAAAGHVVVLDGLATCVAALVAVQADPAVQSKLVAAHVSRELGHQLILRELGLEQLMALRLRAGEGIGACLGAQLLLTGLAVRRSAGLTK